ncbi:ArdC family protein [Proteus mirabilis]|uniref:ArdC family protein n=1 Tax=Proteus mirabilis TaxID=584 RepID=UPI001A20D6F0|nr:zincin-like metallopeptidase domain-containing protein [Proteus mirabilis]MDH7535187.1 zincin-like metallopeptidase domain-containing protein [Proteus mirabilis]MDM3629601.1 zincin-like metallopeptidase domain-containing protein [Proteus mirabilis]MDM3641097.1 zincin-like metallopeptidase domain-containing protein [Proteus mirabilis]MDM3708930.1 zincin-like metallopeptidase domain-containing protein [Proteus mirabilis]MDM3782996.1 zincin-like metallopeptidase domain-containing protein [Prot
MKKELIGRTSSRQNDLYRVVTNKIIEALEKGTEPWRKTWNTENEGLPVNAATGRYYSGINVMLLWMGAIEKGVNSNRWLTFNQAKCAGGSVRRGEKSTLVTLFKPITENKLDSEITETEDKLIHSSRCFMTSFHLFNIEQCENLPESFYVKKPTLTHFERIDKAETIVISSGIPVIHRYQDCAYYHTKNDHIVIPEMGQFHSVEDYYCTLLHELVHSTGHISRLARKGIMASLPMKMNNPVYAFEELIAEIGSAFLCAELGIQGHLQHESYIASWLKILKKDHKAIFQADKYAREAFEYLILNINKK